MVVVLHPDESILLAFVRRQLRDDEWPGIQQHIASCPQCRQRCAEYDQVGAFLRQWATLEYYNTNSALTGRVLQRINAPTSVLERWQERVKIPSLRLATIPVAVVLVMLFSIVLFAIAYRGPSTGHGNANSVQHIVLTPTEAVRTIRQTPTPRAKTPTPTPTAISNNDNDDDNHGQSDNDHDNDNGPSSGGDGNLYLCRGQGDHNAFALQVCGSNFTPGEHIYLIFTVQGYQFQPHEPIQVEQDGNFTTSFIVPNCRLVPTAIDAVDTNNNQLAPTLSNIQLARCSGQN